MQLANNALQIHRQGIQFPNVQAFDSIMPSTKCFHAYSQLSDCIMTNKLNVLNHDAVRATCNTEEWRTDCPGAIRRNHIQKIYRRSLNNRLYTQDQLDQYMKAKNNHKHWGIIDHRY